MPYSGHRELSIKWSSVCLSHRHIMASDYGTLNRCLFFKIRGTDKDKERHSRTGEEIAGANAQWQQHSRRATWADQQEDGRSNTRGKLKSNLCYVQAQEETSKGF